MSEHLARAVLEQPQPEELKELVISAISESALTQGRVSKEAGLSPAALNQWLQGEYKGDNVELESKLIKWLSARERRAVVNNTMPEKGAYIATPSGERILGGLSYAQAAADLLVLYGGAGVGKTKSIKQFASFSPNVWVVTMRPDTAGVAACLEEIGEAMGVKMPARAARMSRDLSSRMEGTGGLLVIDEAQHLNVAAVEAVRSIYDRAEIGLVLCGNELVYARLTGGNRSATFAQIFSRIGKRLRLSLPTKGDVTAIADAYGITGKEEQQALIEISQKPGALRAVIKTINFAAIMAAGNAETINFNYISAAWSELGGDI